MNSITGRITPNPLPDSDPETLAKNFADFFMSKIENIRKKLDSVPLYEPSGIKGKEITDWQPLTERELWQIIVSLGTKSCESDAIPTKLLKENLDVLLPPLLNIMNESLAQGVFPAPWKQAIIRPLLKKTGLEQIASNYRPVSNLKFVSKVCEKAMLSRFQDHCKENQLESAHQSAYKHGHSYETSITKIYNDLLWSMENQEASALVAIDLSAAFDTVDHNVLLKVLERRFGLKGATLKWADSYLRPRQCTVNVETSYSKLKDLPYCVPQGSCAGPAYFNAYCSTLADVVPQNITLNGFADDHTLQTSWNIKEPNEESSSITHLEGTLANIEKWMQSNHLKMNNSKTEFIVFNSKHLDQYITLRSIDVNGENVQVSEVIRYLGAWLDKHLTMRQHIREKCKAAVINTIHLRNRKYLTLDASKFIASALVL